ncbi:MAG TPA: 5-(carboxyamino)imidazole ribonucleotide mutase [Planctomycetota bacterium]|jgi:phosphoribosylaminoimidazole carboxylase PurE protein|nr:5-(carboxyamino)imidazole ribonucleotide mutase [Planctomycetota bacterium]
MSVPSPHSPSPPLSPVVAVLLGSDSDLPKLQGCLEALGALEIPYEVRVLSAHRSPEALEEFVAEAPRRGARVLICAAGGAAHLAGTVAARTDLPVIGIPVEGPLLGGLDALLSTVQMPGGVPVATVGVGAGGPRNAAVLAARILALGDGALARRLATERARMASEVLEKDRAVREKHGRRP